VIRVCDFQKAEELRKKFNIKPIEAGEKMPLPKIYIWTKKGLTRYSFIIYLLSFLGIFITGYLSDKLGVLSEDTPFYFIIPFSVSFFLWLGSVVYNIFQEKRK
jgi:positive regulator of sigma E activity